jgi:UDP-N-acetylglucosamine acyltransferase
MAIHPTAIVHKGAEIDPTADIGPYCVIGPKVKIGPSTRLLSHVVMENDVTVGARNVIYPFACLGGAPQDFKFKGEPSRVVVGDDNQIRESVTVHLGTASGHMETRVGNNCLIMAYCHIAHDCTVGNRVVMASTSGLAGHVTIDDFVIIGGMSGVHQFCRIGRNGYVAGGTLISQGVPPFCIAKGDRARLAAINIIGLRRSGWSRERINAVRHAFQLLFRSGLPARVALERTEAELAPGSAEVAEMCQFIRGSKRGVCRAWGGQAAEEPFEDED